MNMRLHRFLARTLAPALLVSMGVLSLTPAHGSTVAFRAAAEGSVTDGSVTTPQTSNITFTANGAASSAGSGNVTPVLPGHQVGDLLVCLVESRDVVAHSVATAGWTQRYTLISSVGSENNHRASLFWKIAASTSETNPAVTHTGGSNIVARCSGFRGVDTATPFDVASGASTAAYTPNDDFVTTATLTPVTSGAMLLFAAHFNVTTDLDVAPAGWTSAYYSTTGLALYHRIWPTSPVTPLPILDLDSNARSHGVVLALRPAVPSPVPPPAGALTIAKPTGTITDDVMIASIAVARSTSGVLAVTAPAGWTLINEVNQSNANRSQLLTYSRVVGAGEPASYTWSFSGTHLGAVGGIVSFSGVDTGAPVDAQSGVTTASSRDHTAPNISTTLDRGMLLTSHEFASSRTWSTHTNMDDATEVVEVSSQTNVAGGISLGMFYEARPTAGSIGGARTARAPTGANDVGATQSISLKARPLICFNDDFNRANGTPGSSWAVSNSGGSFGNPVIAANRLRLTNATDNVATLATLQRLFPGAGNRIEIEFDFLAYGGSGADGVALVLSDSAVTPVAGGYGGALGYAMKNAIPGFAGGWLGVGVDEFGNFSSNELGKPDGPGQRVDSVAIRGSGAGLTGYRYHQGTGTLAPGIDGSFTPAHRYRVIVDHSNGTNAQVSVERDVGAGYVMLVSPYDAKAQPGQAAVPAGWILSLTGSTGGANNIHEIDNLQICATSQTAISAIHHFEITTVASASTCTPHEVTITAKDASNNTVTNYTGPITISTSSSHGTWSVVSANGSLADTVADDGVAAYSFVTADNGVITLALANTHADDMTINVVETGVPATSSTSGTVNFRDSAFVIAEDSIQIAGRPQAMTATLYTRIGNSCPIDSGYSGLKDLDAWITRISPDPNGTAPTIGALSLPGTAPAVNTTTHNLSLTFANGVASFNMDTTDVGKYALNLRDDTRIYANAIDILGASNDITTRPWLNVQVASNPATDLPTGGVLTSASSPFSATVRGVLWNGGDDANNDGIPNVGANLNDNNVAPRFAWLTNLSAVLPIAPIGGVIGSVSNGAIAQASYVANTGAATVNNLTYSEVGSFTLQALASNYLNTAAADLTGTLTPVGRFIPHHFAVSGGTLTNRSAAGCTPASTFTYMNEGIAVSYSITAQNLTNGTTQNYTGPWATLNLNTPAAHNFGARNVATGTALSSRLAVNSIAGSWSGGSASVTGNVTLTRASPDNPPDGPYSDFRIGVAPVEGPTATTNLDLDVDGIAPNDRVQLGSATQIRYGRLRLLGGLSTTTIPLPISMRLEYWDGNSFVTNTLDSCTTLARSAITLSDYQADLVACETAFNTPMISFSNGTATPLLLAPGGGNDGSVDLRVVLGTPAPSDQYCSAVGASPTSATSAARSYLLGRWNDGADPDTTPSTHYDDDPSARAAFGLSDKTSQRVIYSRENY